MIAFIVWVLILLNAIRTGKSIIANGFPLSIFVGGVFVDLVIAVVTLVSLRKAYRRRLNREASKGQTS